MREFINIILESVNDGTFVLDPALDPKNYVMTNSLKDAAKWRAMCYVGNNGDDNIGKMTEIGYVMISKTSNRIIPISRDDEHHTGYDLLYDFQSGDYPYGKRSKKLAINVDDYIPIFTQGNNYVYKKSDLPALVSVLTRFLSYGGRDGILKGTSEMSGMQMHLSDFVARRGKVEITPGTLAPLGQKTYDAFANLANAIRSLGATPDRIKAQPVFRQAQILLKFIDESSMDFGVEINTLTTVANRIKIAQKENDIQELEKAIFGFHGLKNEVHVYLKKLVKGANEGDDMSRFYLGRVKGIWGDVDLAIDMLGCI